MQADGYDGYRGLTERGDVALAFRWSHVRRRFYELAVAGPAPIASEALQRAELYAVEAEARGRSADERRALRQIKSQPILDAFEPWLRKKIELITSSPKRSAMRCRAPPNWRRSSNIAAGPFAKIRLHYNSDFGGREIGKPLDRKGLLFIPRERHFGKSILLLQMNSRGSSRWRAWGHLTFAS